MVDIKDSRKIVYVFDASCAREDYGIVKEHVINYLNAEVMKLASKLAEDSSDDKGGPVFVKSGRRGKNNI